jgi:hypothetical protein
MSMPPTPMPMVTTRQWRTKRRKQAREIQRKSKARSKDRAFLLFVILLFVIPGR